MTLPTRRTSHTIHDSKRVEYEHPVDCHINSWCTVLVEKLRHSSVFFLIDISAVRISLAIYDQRWNTVFRNCLPPFTFLSNENNRIFQITVHRNRNKRRTTRYRIAIGEILGRLLFKRKHIVQGLHLKFSVGTFIGDKLERVDNFDYVRDRYGVHGLFYRFSILAILKLYEHSNLTSLL